MSNLYKQIKQLPDLYPSRFRADKFREGFYAPLRDDASAVFNVAGGWSYVSLSAGIRFGRLNDFLYQCAVSAGWPKHRAALFQLELVGLYDKKVADFCASQRDIGEYCPQGSQVASVKDIIATIDDNIYEIRKITTLSSAVIYVRDNALYDPFGAYMLPAASKICGNRRLWDWSLEYFSRNPPDYDQRLYANLIEELGRRPFQGVKPD